MYMQWKSNRNVTVSYRWVEFLLLRLGSTRVVIFALLRPSSSNGSANPGTPKSYSRKNYNMITGNLNYNDVIMKQIQQSKE